MGEINLHERSIELVNEVFRVMQGVYPGFRQSWPREADLASAKREWTKAFLESGLMCIDQVKLGLAKARSIDQRFPPSCGTFISWCKPDRSSLSSVSLDEGFRIACANSHPCASQVWPDGIVYETWRRTGPFRLRTMSEKSIFPIFEKNYHEVVDDVLNKGRVFDIPKQIEMKEKSFVTNPGIAEEFLSRIRRKVGVSV